MAEMPPTRPTLLHRLRDAHDRDAWRQFVELYAPLVYGLARRHGLQDSDAADLTQDVLRSVSGAVGRFEYDPRRGRFRNWLFTAARRRIAAFRAAASRRPVAAGDTDARERLEQLPAPDDEEQFWEQEYRRRLFAWAAERVRPSFTEPSWRAFWLTAVEGRDPAAVAAELGLSLGAVYVAKSRALARIREQVRQAEDEE
jgi:RNA polymerase sigma factor (sigma-70 family)